MRNSRVNNLRREIPLTKKYVYFDNSATSLTPKRVVEAMNRYYFEYCSNVERGGYRLAHRAMKEYDEAREKIAALLVNCHPDELIFTRNFTEGANIVAYALEHSLLDCGRNNRFNYQKGIVPLRKGDNIVCTAIEHHSNSMPWIRLAKHKKLTLRMATPNKEGLLSPEVFSKLVDRRTRFVAFQHVSNAIGTIHPIEEIIKVIRKKSPRVLIFVDGAQAAGHMKVDFKSLGCDFYCFSGHKGPLGPKGTGALLVKKNILKNMEPLVLGGGMILDVGLNGYRLKSDFRRFDAGSPYIPGLIGLGVSAEYLAREIGLDRIKRYEDRLMKKLIKGLKTIDSIELYGPNRLNERSGIVSFNVKGWLCHDVSLALDEKWKILTRAGHFCCIPLMRFLKILEPYSGSVRVSLHYYNTEEEVDCLISALREFK